MSHIVADVTKDTPTEYRGSYRPVPVEHSVCEFPEWGCKSNKESGRHDQSKLIHWEIVMDTVKQKMCCQANSIIRKISKRRSEAACCIWSLKLTCRDGIRIYEGRILPKSIETHPKTNMKPVASNLHNLLWRDMYHRSHMVTRLMAQPTKDFW